MIEEQKPMIVDYSGLPVIPQEKAECYWCNKVLDKEKMSRTKQYNMTVYVCNGCGG